MENDFISLGFRHDSILLVYTHMSVLSIDINVCLQINMFKLNYTGSLVLHRLYIGFMLVSVVVPNYVAVL